MKHDVRMLFHELVDLPPDHRERVLAGRQIEPEIREELESLLRFDSTNIEGLTGCVADAAEQVLHAASGLGSCGPYRLVRLLGSGGMGAVYLGERSDGEIQQKVAIKLLRADAHRPSWRDRFLRERQILASLHHPSIVHVIDAGHTADGRPYLVMEYVDGVPIDVYCASLELNDRLKLFLDVCDGVSHAHRHLIIHRDLKPSNILVDTSGQPKLLDFGIAKLLDETGDATQTIDRLLTPNYASPEQRNGAIQTTATDVYSLGAVLHQVLTGRTHNQSAADGIPSRLPADVDSILRRALRQEPEERYASVEAFAGDIRAFLESRPVQARSGNAWYRARKFARRYRIPVVAAALAVASLTAGLYVADRERAIARRRFSDVRQLANKLFDIDGQASELAGNTKTRQLIVDTSLEYLRRLAADVRGDPELALEVGNAYLRVARVQGVPISSNLGQMDQAEQNLRIAEQVIRPVLVSEPANRKALLLAAQIAHDRMVLARFTRSGNELLLARQSAALLEKYNAGKNDRPDSPAILHTYVNVADAFMRGEQYDDALRLCRRGIEIARSFDDPFSVGPFLWAESEVYRRRGDLDAALAAAQESVKVMDPGLEGRGQARKSMAYIFALIQQGKILAEEDAISMGESARAVASLEIAYRLADSFVHQDANDQLSRNYLADAGFNLADALRRSDAARSLAIFDHTLGHLAEIKNNSSFRRFEVSGLVASSYPLRNLGRQGEARRRLDAAFDRLRQLKLYPAPAVKPGSEAFDALRALAGLDAGNGNPADAIGIYGKLLDQVQAGGANPEGNLSDAVRVSNIYLAEAALQRKAGRAGLALPLEARRAEIWHRWEAKLPHNAFVHRQLEGAALP